MHNAHTYVCRYIRSDLQKDIIATHIQFWSLRSVIQLVFHLQLSNLAAGLDPIIALI